jgi:predicted AlkP superfamily pyrophosphatase or phosphodiesterase
MPQPTQVVLFVIDGLRPDALSLTPSPSLDLLAAQGTRATQACSVCPSISLPCHASLFLAVPPTHHGIVTSAWRALAAPIPSLFEVVHQAGLGTAAFYSWEELRDMAPPGALDIAYFRRLQRIQEEDPDLAIAKAATEYLIEHKPSLTFVYLGATDEVGHEHGWMSLPYLQAVSKADHAVGLVVRALQETGLWASTTCFVVADHGGHELDHAEGTREDLHIPWIAGGEGIHPGQTLEQPISILDTAPTILYLLGQAVPEAWQGHVIAETMGG